VYLYTFAEANAQSDAVKQAVLAMYSDVADDVDEQEQYPLFIVLSHFSILQ